MADGHYIFGVRRKRYLNGMIHWVQDFMRIHGIRSLDEFNRESAAFCEALDNALNCAKVRRVEKEQSNTVSKAANPGKFKDKRKLPEWEPSFVNYLLTSQE